MHKGYGQKVLSVVYYSCPDWGDFRCSMYEEKTNGCTRTWFMQQGAGNQNASRSGPGGGESQDTSQGSARGGEGCGPYS